MQKLMLSRRHLIGLGLGGLGTAALAVRPRLAEAASRVALQLSWLHSVQFAGSYIAQDRGYWADRGLSVRLDSGGPNAPVEPPVVAGTALVGISAADYAAAAVTQGAPFRIIGVQMQKNPFTVASLPAKPVRRPRDMEGMRIGMATANTPVLRALCTINDVDMGRIEIVPTQYDAAPLLAGEVDCLLCWETDLPVAMAVQGVESVTMPMADFGYRLHSQTYIATERSLAERREEVVALMAGEAAGWQGFRQDPEAAARLTVDRFPDAGLDIAVQTEKARRQKPLMFSEETAEHGFGWFTEEGVAANVEILDLLGTPVDAELWDRSILEEIHAG